MFCEDLERRELRHLEDPAKDVNIVGVCVIVSGSVSGAPCLVRRKVEQFHAPRDWGVSASCLAFLFLQVKNVSLLNSIAGLLPPCLT